MSAASDGPKDTDTSAKAGGAQPADGERPADLRRQYLLASAEAETLRTKVGGSEWMASRIAELEAELSGLRRQIDDYRSATPEVASAATRSIRRRLRGRVGSLARTTGLRRPPAAAPVEAPLHDEDVGVGGVPPRALQADPRYPAWIALYDTVDDEARRAIRRRLDGLTDPPLVTIILPVYNTPEPYLREAIESVRSQLYERWELCIADDCSTAAWVPKVLAEYAELDERIRVERRDTNGHISASSNTAIGMARGAWLALFDHDDILAEHALALAVLALADVPGAGALYSDEDHIDDEGNRSVPYFKPDFDPLLLCGQNYFSHLCMLRRDLVDRVGGFRLGYEGSQDWDLVLRVVENLDPAQVVHVPHVLYHWRVHPGSTASSLAAKPYAASAANRAVQDHLERSERRGSVLTIGDSGFNRVRWELPERSPAVSIVILPRTNSRFPRCVDSVMARAMALDVEVVVVDDGAFRPPLRGILRDRDAALHVVEDRRPVSDAALRNSGARAARGNVLCFLGDDVEAHDDRWLEELVALLLQPGIGAVGAKLVYPDGRVEHAGIVMGIGSTLGHPHRFVEEFHPGYFGRAMLAQSFSAVSWSCMAVRREAFDAVGGFDEEHLPALFADADLCLRLGESGWRVAWTPNAQLTHFATPSHPRPTDAGNGALFAREVRYLQTRWAEVSERDPAYNPNLSLAHETWPLAWPPRVSYR